MLGRVALHSMFLSPQKIVFLLFRNQVLIFWRSLPSAVDCTLRVLCCAQTSGATAAAVLRASWTPMNVSRAPVSAPAWLVILVCSVRTVRMASSPTVPAAVWPAPVTPSAPCTFSATGQPFAFFPTLFDKHWNLPSGTPVAHPRFKSCALISITD